VCDVIFEKRGELKNDDVVIMGGTATYCDVLFPVASAASFFQKGVENKI
jgi:hypothetical protein